MIASSTTTPSQLTTQNLQNSLTAEASATERSPVVAALSQAAVNEFALRFNAAVFEMLATQGVSSASPLSRRLKAYSPAGVAAVAATSRFV